MFRLSSFRLLLSNWNCSSLTRCCHLLPDRRRRYYFGVRLWIEYHYFLWETWSWCCIISKVWAPAVSSTALGCLLTHSAPLCGHELCELCQFFVNQRGLAPMRKLGDFPALTHCLQTQRMSSPTPQPTAKMTTSCHTNPNVSRWCN